MYMRITIYILQGEINPISIGTPRHSSGLISRDGSDKTIINNERMYGPGASGSLLYFLHPCAGDVNCTCVSISDQNCRLFVVPAVRGPVNIMYFPLLDPRSGRGGEDAWELRGRASVSAILLIAFIDQFSKKDTVGCIDPALPGLVRSG